MTKPSAGHRRSIRLPEYDYEATGAYFVTICAWQKHSFFDNDVIRRIVEDTWNEIPRHFDKVLVDAFVVMPNHLHGILVIPDLPVGADPRVGPPKSGAHTGAPLPTIVQWFKTMTTNRYMRAIKTSAWAPCRGRLWQRNYYEHVIRDEKSLNRIRQYILDNPVRWTMDPENPSALTVEPEPGRAHTWVRPYIGKNPVSS